MALSVQEWNLGAVDLGWEWQEIYLLQFPKNVGVGLFRYYRAFLFFFNNDLTTVSVVTQVSLS